MAKPIQSSVSTPNRIKITFDVWLINTPHEGEGDPACARLRPVPPHPAVIPRVDDTARTVDRFARDLPAHLDDPRPETTTLGILCASEPWAGGAGTGSMCAVRATSA